MKRAIKKAVVFFLWKIATGFGKTKRKMKNLTEGASESLNLACFGILILTLVKACDATY